jgi:hypothetical protein
MAKNPVDIDWGLSGASSLWDNGLAGDILNQDVFGVPEAPPPATGGKIKVWTGSAWVLKPVKVWTGSAWVEKPLKRWNGSTWVLT